MSSIKYKTIFTASAFSSFIIGYSSFVTKLHFDFNMNEGTSDLPIAYFIDSADGTTKRTFVSVEAAIKAAYNDQNGNIIYILPYTNSYGETDINYKGRTISNDCVVASNDTLFLMYDENTFSNSSKANTQNGAYAESSSNNLKNAFIIGDGVTLTNNGKIEISGILSSGSGGQSKSGNSTSSYAEILLDNNSKLISNGEIDCYGFINETSFNNGSKAILNNQSSLYVPFIINDFRGGGVSSGLVNKNIFPFEQYQIRNIGANITANYGSSIFVWTNLYANSSYYAFTIKLLGDNVSSDGALFELNNAEQSYVNIKYINESQSYTDEIRGTLSDCLLIDFYGGMDMASMNINFAGTNISTDEYEFPINYHMQLSFNDNSLFTGASNYNLPFSYKFMTGSSLLINENTNVSINQLNIFNYFNQSADTFTEGSEAAGDGLMPGTKYPSKGPAIFYNDGSTTITSFGGLIIKGNNSDFHANNSSVTSTEGRTYKNGFLIDDITDTITIKEHMTEISLNDFKQMHRLNFVIEEVSNTTEPTYDVSINGSYMGSYSGYCSLFANDGDILNISSGNNVSKIMINGNDYNSNSNFTVTDDLEITVVPNSSQDSGGGGSQCFLPNSRILLSNGKYKYAKDLRKGDFLLTYNHFTGKFESQELLVCFKRESSMQDLIDLYFDNGDHLQIATGHGLFNLTRGRYEIYYGKEFLNHIGEIFVSVKKEINGTYKLDKTKLINVLVERKELVKYSPVSEYNINCICENILNVPDDIECLFYGLKYKSFDEGLRIDLEDLNMNIQKFGLINYDEVKDIIPKYVFEKFNFKLFRVFLGLNVLTIDKLNYLLDEYIQDVSDFNNIKRNKTKSFTKL